MRILSFIRCRRSRGGCTGLQRSAGRPGLICAWAGVWLFFAAAPLSFAADAPPKSAANTNYRIGAGDLLNVEVVGRRDLSAQYTVGQDGVLFMPLTGGVPAQGKTAAELGAELARRLSLYDRDINQVNVSVAEFRSQKIFVLGAVLRPGKYSFAELPTVWDAIGEAGGPTEDAQLSAVEVIPSEGTSGRTTQVVDVAAAIREGRVASMERLRPGDTVRVPRGGGVGLSPTSNAVYLFGAIARQGPVSMDKPTDLMSAIIQSGGPTPDADLSDVQIVRQNSGRTVHLKVNLNHYLDKATPAGNPPLVAGDTVYLRRQQSRGFFATLRTFSPLLALASTVLVFVRR